MADLSELRQLAEKAQRPNLRLGAPADDYEWFLGAEVTSDDGLIAKFIGGGIGDVPRANADARSYVAMVSALTALLDVVEAAQQLMSLEDKADPSFGTGMFAADLADCLSCLEGSP